MKANVKKLSPFIVGDSRYGIKMAPIKRRRVVHKGISSYVLGEKTWVSLCNDYSYAFRYTEWKWADVTCKLCLKKRPK